MLGSPQFSQITSVLTRPANTTAYAQGDLIADNVTAGSIIVPSFAFPRSSSEMVEVIGGRLITNLTTGFSTFQGHIDLWSAAPTFTNGDNGAFAVATGAAGWLGHMTTELATSQAQFGDGAVLAVVNGQSYADDYARNPCIFPQPALLYWSLRELDATGFTPISGQTFTLSLDIRLH